MNVKQTKKRQIMQKLSPIALALIAFMPLVGQAAMTFTPGTQPTGVPTFSGTMAVPPYKLEWRWGTNNISALDANVSQMTGGQRVMTFNAQNGLPSTTLLTGYTTFGVNPGALFGASVTWAGSTSDVLAQERYIRKIETPLLNMGGVRIGKAELYLTGITGGLGGADLNDIYNQYYLLSLANSNATTGVSCGGMAGNAKGLASNSSTTVFPTGFNELRLRLQTLLDNAQGVTSAPLPATPQTAVTYLNAERTRVGITSQGGGVAPVSYVNMETRPNSSFFGSTGAIPKFSGEYRCALGFTGQDANEKLVLTFDKEITALTEWRIILTPTVTFS